MNKQNIQPLIVSSYVSNLNRIMQIENLNLITLKALRKIIDNFTSYINKFMAII